MLQFRSRAKSRATRVVCYLALMAIAVRTFDLGAETISSHFRFHVIQNGAAKGQDAVQQKTANRPALALNKVATDLSFVLSLSLLRFDFKQNLRTWPVLANDIARSPPPASLVNFL